MPRTFDPSSEVDEPIRSVTRGRAAEFSVRRAAGVRIGTAMDVVAIMRRGEAAVAHVIDARAPGYR